IHLSHKRERILLPNLLQSSRSTLSWGSFLRYFAFKEGRLGTPISVLGGWATVSGRFLHALPKQMPQEAGRLTGSPHPLGTAGSARISRVLPPAGHPAWRP